MLGLGLGQCMAWHNNLILAFRASSVVGRTRREFTILYSMRNQPGRRDDPDPSSSAHLKADLFKNQDEESVSYQTMANHGPMYKLQ